MSQQFKTVSNLNRSLCRILFSKL